MSNRRLRPALAALLLASLPLALHADPLEDGLKAAEARDFTRAFAIWTPLADQGNPVAQFYLSSLYARGLGVEANDSTALRWMQGAAEGGYAPAQFNIGNHWVRTLGETEEAYRKAVPWWRKAAEGGFAPAQHNLGMLYLDGRVIERDERQAREWLSRAAAAGSKRSEGVLAELNAKGGASLMKKGPPVRPEPMLTGPVQGGAPAKGEKVGGPPALEPEAGEAWIGAQAPDAYTLQVFSGEGRASAGKAAASIPAELGPVLFRFRRDGRPYFGVVVGSFADPAAARGIESRLSEELIKARPWVRRFRDLQILVGRR